MTADLELLRPYMDEISKRLDAMLPLPSAPVDMSARDHDLYLRLAEAFSPMRDLLEKSQPPGPSLPVWETPDRMRRLFYLLEEHRLLTGAWVGVPFNDLPEHVRAALADIVLRLSGRDATTGGNK